MCDHWKKDVSLVCKVGPGLLKNFAYRKKKILRQKVWKFIFSNNTVADVKATNHMRFPSLDFQNILPSSRFMLRILTTLQAIF